MRSRGEPLMGTGMVAFPAVPAALRQAGQYQQVFALEPAPPGGQPLRLASTLSVRHGRPHRLSLVVSNVVHAPVLILASWRA